VNAPDASERAAAARRGGRVALGVALALFLVYGANGPWRGAAGASADNLPARYLPFTILRHGSFYLDDMPEMPSRHAYYVRRVGGHLVSDYPVGTPLLALPMYAPFVLAGLDPRSPLVPWLDKTAAAALVAASGAILYLALRRLTGGAAALALALVYGLGTSALSVSSQGLWQHAGSQLALATALYCVLRGRQSAAFSAASGFPMAFAVLCRPTDALLLAPLAAYTLATRRDWRFVVWSLPPIAFQLWYGATYFGDPLRTQVALGGGAFRMDVEEGLYGLLLSPGRGLLAYSPIFALSIVGAALVWRPGGDAVLRAVSLGIVPTVLLYARWMAWTGGLSYGPRLLADLTPLLTVLITPVVPLVRRSRALWAASVVLALWSVAAHAYGLVPAWGSHVYYRIDGPLDDRLWEWRHHPVVGWVVRPSRPDAERSPEPFFAGLDGWQRGDGHVRLAVADRTFALGETARLGLDVDNPTDRALDLYVAIYSPASRVAVFIPARDTLTTPVSIARPEWFHRFGTLNAGGRLSEPRLLRFTFPHHTTPETLYVIAALVEPGSHPWRVVTADVERVDVVPVE
jgi:hypothetical protein